MLPSWQPVLTRAPHHARCSFYNMFLNEAHIRGRNSNWRLCFPVGSFQSPVMKLYDLKNTNSARKHTWIGHRIDWYRWADYLWFSSQATVSRYDDDINCVRVSCGTTDQVSSHSLDGFGVVSGSLYHNQTKFQFPLLDCCSSQLCAVSRAPLWGGGSTAWPFCVMSTFKCP